MSGIICYAIVRYRVKNKITRGVSWKDSTINKQHKQSDRAFVKFCERLLKANESGMLKGSDLTLGKQKVKYFNKSDKEIRDEVMNYVR